MRGQTWRRRTRRSVLLISNELDYGTGGLQGADIHARCSSSVSCSSKVRAVPKGIGGVSITCSERLPWEMWTRGRPSMRSRTRVGNTRHGAFAAGRAGANAQRDGEIRTRPDTEKRTNCRSKERFAKLRRAAERAASR